tara:strand:- start:43 stop:228 length:186 start_codon:yes stop_codon:yes gene_type:complete
MAIAFQMETQFDNLQDVADWLVQFRDTPLSEIKFADRLEIRYTEERTIPCNQRVSNIIEVI